MKATQITVGYSPSGGTRLYALGSDGLVYEYELAWDEKACRHQWGWTPLPALPSTAHAQQEAA